MAEYIEREAALTEQNKSMNLSEMRERLKHIPAADVIERKHGKWEPGKIVHFGEIESCSECGETVRAIESDILLRSTEHYNFCPNCGADMRGEDDEL